MAGAKFMALVDGARVHVPARRFCHYIQGEQFWFAYHEALDCHATVVSHWESGKRVCVITSNQAIACLGDKKAAAKMALDALCEKHGAARVRSVIAGAEK